MYVLYISMEGMKPPISSLPSKHYSGIKAENSTEEGSAFRW
jgi:hypothetical protein